jgi:hypothetical protein
MVHHQKEEEQSILCFFLKKTFLNFVIEKNRKEGKGEGGKQADGASFRLFYRLCMYVRRW